MNFGTIFGIAKTLIKGLFKFVVFTGFYWILIAGIPGEIYGLVTGNRIPDWLVDIFLYPALILVMFTTTQNLLRIVKKDRSFSLIHAIINRYGNMKGIESELDGDTVLSVSSRDLRGMVFGKLKGKFVVKPEATDGHILIIGGPGSGKTSGIAIPTLPQINWKRITR